MPVRQIGHSAFGSWEKDEMKFTDMGFFLQIGAGRYDKGHGRWNDRIETDIFSLRSKKRCEFREV